jgi:hypothetical protein
MGLEYFVIAVQKHVSELLVFSQPIYNAERAVGMFLPTDIVIRHRD